MNAETKEPEKVEGPDAPKREPTMIKSTAYAIFLFVIAVVAILGVWFSAVNYRSISLLEEHAHENTVSDQFTSRLEAIETTLDAVDAEQRQTAASLAELTGQQKQNTAGLQTLFSSQRDDDVDLIVAEVEHLIIIATHRLSLERDVKTALTAMEAADSRLAGLGHPGLFNTRKQLAEDIDALRAVAPVDITGLALYLGNLGNHVQELPLREISFPGPSADPVIRDEPSAWKQLLTSVWREFRAMFTVTRTGTRGTATLLPDERYFLYQNLRLQLETARLAVIRRDTETLSATVEMILIWLDEYFDNTAGRIVDIREVLTDMQSLELDPELPDLSSSLETLRAYMSSRRKPEASEMGTVIP